MQRFYQERRDERDFREERTVSGFVRHLLLKVDDLWLFYLSSAFDRSLLALLVLTGRHFAEALPLSVPPHPCAAFGCRLAVQTWTMDITQAPATCLILFCSSSKFTLSALWQAAKQRQG